MSEEQVSGQHNRMRSVEEVLLVAEKAKLSVDQLLPVCQSLSFSEHFDIDQKDIKLVEVDQHVIECLQNGDKLVFRGRADDAAVLCTPSRTYEVREAETSNSLLLLDSLRLPHQLTESQTATSVSQCQVRAIMHSYLELRETGARARRLHQLLQERPYSGRHEPATGYQLSQLLQLVQCSQQQLEQQLNQLPAVLIDGSYYGLKFEYEFAVLDHVLRLFDENSWHVTAAPASAASHVTDELAHLYPPAVITACLHKFFQNSRNSDGECMLVCREQAVCRMFALMLLRPVSSFNMQEFLSVWSQAVPDGVSASVEMLLGVAVVVDHCTPAVITRLTADQLPELPADRLRVLFDVKPRWSLQQLRPYLEDLESKSQSMASILSKHTRCVNVAGEKLYTARHINS